MRIPFGGAGEIAPVEAECDMDHFENHIRKIGVVYVCEWFGYDWDSEFTRETIRVLRERTSNKSRPADASVYRGPGHLEQTGYLEPDK